jgi:hypothetical protein
MVMKYKKLYHIKCNWGCTITTVKEIYGAYYKYDETWNNVEDNTIFHL